MDSNKELPPSYNKLPPNAPEHEVVQKVQTPNAPQHEVLQKVQIFQWGPQPQFSTCPSCHDYILSRTEHEPSSKTHLFALVICLLGGLCCCCIPYCVDSCQSTKHLCPKCGAYLGIYSN